MTRAGIYIHIPFCRSRCSYCDFATGMYEGELARRYVDAIVSEIFRWREVAKPGEVDTIYFGGGTPSLLEPAQVERILAAVQSRFRVTPNAEVTMEMNPTSVSSFKFQVSSSELSDDELPQHKAREFRRLGINRASFGAQTFDDLELKQLGRTHNSGDIRTTFADLREAGFQNINFDLIAGLPAQTLAGWQHNLDEALKLEPEHLSLYLLDVHEGTPLADQIRRGTRLKPDDDLAADMYRAMIAGLVKAGYEHYEISNFCRPGFESRHNTKYWSGAAYYSFGCSAHSFDGRLRRWSNERDAAKYVDVIEREKTPIVDTTNLRESEARAESVFLGLRLMRGFDLAGYRSRFGADLLEEYDQDLTRLANAGLIEIDNNLLKLTTRGVLLSNEVFATFV